MRSLTWIALSAALLVLAVPTGGASGAGATSGLYGKVTKGPVLPVCRRSGRPCYVAAAHARLTFLRGNRVAARVRTRANGTYRIALAKGRYSVRTNIGRGGIRPMRVTVPSHRFARVNFRADTAIR